MSRGEEIEIRATRPNYPYTQILLISFLGLIACGPSKTDGASTSGRI